MYPKNIFSGTIFLLLFFPIAALAQSVTIIDESTLQPIEDVYIYDKEKKKTALTDQQGRAGIAKFSSGDTLVFRHPSYKQVVRTYSQLQQNDFLVKLHGRVVMMDEIFVSASKRKQDQTEIPRKIRQIDTEEVAFYNPQTAADMLQASGEVFVQKSQLGGGSPFIRGFAANSVLIAVDGIRINNAIFRSGNLQNVISIDPNALSWTEVVFGPGSIIYGSDALGGVMDYKTKDAELSFAKNETYIKTHSLVRYSSANNERTVHGDANIGFEKWGFLTSVTYSDYDDLRSGGNFYNDFPDFGRRDELVVRRNGMDQVIQNDDPTHQISSGYEQLNLMQKIRFKPSQDWSLDYGFHFATTGDIPRYDRLIQRKKGGEGPLKNAEWYYGPQTWMMHALKIDHHTETTLYDRIEGTFSYQEFQESRNDRKFQSATLRNREENVDVATANIDFDKQLDEASELFYGIEGVYNHVRSDAHSTNIETGLQAPVATRYPGNGSDYTQLAAYAKYQRDLSSKVTAIAGARYSHVLLNADFGNQNFYDFPFEKININTGAVNGSLGFTYRPAEDVQFSLNGSTGFRAPNVDDAAKVFDSEPGTVVVPNNNLKPEFSYNIDFGVIKRFGEQARLEVNTFYTRLEDAHVRRDFGRQFGQDSVLFDGELSRVEAVVNAGKAYIYGASAGLSVELSSHFGFNSTITYTKGQDLSNDEPLRHIAPVFGRVGLSYTADKTKIRLYSQFNAKKDISDFSPSERKKTHLYTKEGSPGWATINLKTSYQINKQIRINAGIENILDQHYRPYSSGISAPGRNILIGLRTAF